MRKHKIAKTKNLAYMASGLIALTAIFALGAFIDTESILSFVFGTGSIVSMAAAPLFTLGKNYESFDAENFDAENFNGEVESSLITLTITNAIAATQFVQLFDYLRTISQIANASQTAFNPETADVIVLQSNTNSLVFFDSVGSLVFQNASGTKCTIACTTPNLTYRQLFCASASPMGQFSVNKMRITFTTAGQISNAISVRRTSLFGKQDTDSISPRTYFTPNQYQNLIVDVPLKVSIDAYTGLSLTMVASETITLELFVSRNAA